MRSYITLFSSAGIGCYGFKQENFKCFSTLELDSKRINIQKYNNICDREEDYIAGDITSEEIKKKLYSNININLKKNNLKKIDLIVATPPCQGMSVANHKKKFELPRNSLVIESIKIISELQPDFFIFENVPSFIKTTCLDIDGNQKTIQEALNFSLSDKYIFITKIINFSEYGSQSSRKRSLTIGALKEKNIFIDELFPKKEKSKKLNKLLNNLKPLNWGEIDSKDFFHNFRTYNKEMRLWISSLKEGESAFNNKDKLRKPHTIKNGLYVANKNVNGDKYKRQLWNKVAPCVHTRNDILASQNTIHPEEDRVFSIRELMLMMTIPKSFQFLPMKLSSLNKLNFSEKEIMLKKEELNIRRCIGEAVPPIIFSKIASNIKLQLNKKELNLKKEFDDFKTTTKVNNLKELKKYLKKYQLTTYTFTEIQIFCELLNSTKTQDAAYYTNHNIAHTIIQKLPRFAGKKTLNILEPSVGCGGLIFPIIEKYSSTHKINLDVIDINQDTLEVFEELTKAKDFGKNVKINIINDDFLQKKFTKKYDLVIGNPPFGKILSKDFNYSFYKSFSQNKKTNNLYIYFLEKVTELADYVCFIVPKSILGAPEFNFTRNELSEFKFNGIYDLGVKAFKGVLIETIVLYFEATKKPKKHSMFISSLITDTHNELKQDYVMDKIFPTWLLYRNAYFNQVAKKLTFGQFTAFRDRQITIKNLLPKGTYRVLKSANIGSNEIFSLPKKDMFLDDLSQFSVRKFLNQQQIICIPNLTYLPRASILPKNSITDGSVALLVLDNPKKIIKKNQLSYFATDEFRNFYKIVRNYSTRSMNIDSNYVFYFGLIV